MSAARLRPLSPEDFARSENVSRETLDRLDRYLRLLERWQKRLNLVGRSTLEDPWRRHMLDSAQLAPLVVGKAVLDIGSGAGFPGLVLAILRPDLEMHLAESDARKCAFLHEAARVAGVIPMIHHIRAEDLKPLQVDTITARAVANLADLLGLAAPFEPEAALFLKGEEAERELTESAAGWTFKAERFPSRSDPRGVILRLTEIHAAGIRHRQPEGRGR